MDIPIVLTPEEVAEALRISVSEVYSAINSQEIEAFEIAGQKRITASALAALMTRTSNGSPADTNRRSKPPRLPPVNTAPSKKNRDPGLEREARRRVLERVREVSPGLEVVQPRRLFLASGKRGIIAVATTPSGPQKTYWFGFPANLLDDERPTAVVPIIGDRPDTAFVIPYTDHAPLFDSLSRDQSGDLKFRLRNRGDTYDLLGLSGQPPLDLSKYLNRFEYFR